MNADGNATYNNVYLGIQGGFTNTGTIQLSGSGTYTATLMVTSGTLTNAVGGAIVTQGSGTGLLSLQAQLDNQGSLTVNKALTLTKDSAAHTNSGTIAVNENLTVDQSVGSPSFTNTGVIMVAAGKTASLNGGTYGHEGTLTGGGTFAPSGLVMTLNSGFSNTNVDLILNYVTVNGPGNANQCLGKGTATLRIDNQFANDEPGHVDRCHRLRHINGTLTQQGTIHVNDTGGATLVVADGFINNGTIELAGTMRVDSGTLGNPPGGVIVNLHAGDHLVANVDNQGTITVSQAMTVGKALSNSGTVEGNADLTVSGAFTNSGTVTLSAGTTLLAYAGITNTSTGTIQGSGTITTQSQTVYNGGALNPGLSPGLLTFSGGYLVQTETGALNIEVGGLTKGTGYDSIAVSYPLTFGGALNVSLINSFTPSVGDSFTIATYASRTGSFGATNYPALTGGKGWCLAYNATSAVLSVLIPPGINIKQETTAIPDNTGSFDVGSSTTGVGKPVTFTIENPGTGILTLSGTPKVQITGTNAAEFAVTTQPPATVGAGESTTFLITFTPAAVGTRTASLSIVNDNCDKNPYNFTLTGTGLAQPQINIKQGATTLANGSGSYPFGNVNVGENKEVTFTIENLGGGPLSLTGTPPVQIGGTNAGEFTVTALPSSTIASGSTTTFKITFAPAAVGSRSATVSIASNDTARTPYTFSLTGTGAGVADIAVRQEGTAIPNGSGSYDFGSVNVNSPKAVVFTVENPGTGALTLTGMPKVQVSGANAAEFVVTALPSSPVAAGGTTTFTITFTPAGAGPRTASISIANDVAGKSPCTFGVTGTGAGQPEINVKQGTTGIADGTGSYDFGTATLGAGKAVTFTVENLGTTAPDPLRDAPRPGGRLRGGGVRGNGPALFAHRRRGDDHLRHHLHPRGHGGAQRHGSSSPATMPTRPPTPSR